MDTVLHGQTLLATSNFHHKCLQYFSARENTVFKIRAKMKDIPQTPVTGCRFSFASFGGAQGPTHRPASHTRLDRRALGWSPSHALCTQSRLLWGVSLCPGEGNGATPDSPSQTPTQQSASLGTPGTWAHRPRPPGPGHPGWVTLRAPQPRGRGTRPGRRPGDPRPAPLYLIRSLGYSAICL